MQEPAVDVAGLQAALEGLRAERESFVEQRDTLRLALLAADRKQVCTSRGKICNRSTLPPPEGQRAYSYISRELTAAVGVLQVGFFACVLDSASAPASDAIPAAAGWATVCLQLPL